MIECKTENANLNTKLLFLGAKTVCSIFNYVARSSSLDLRFIGLESNFFKCGTL